MPVTVLYPEDRQIPDLDLEHEIFGAEVRLIRRTSGPNISRSRPSSGIWRSSG